jgi:hypothetical protein
MAFLCVSGGFKNTTNKFLGKVHVKTFCQKSWGGGGGGVF